MSALALKADMLASASTSVTKRTCYLEPTSGRGRCQGVCAYTLPVHARADRAARAFNIPELATMLP